MRIAVIGFGEVGLVLAGDLVNHHALTCWDIGFVDPDSAPSHNASSLHLRPSKGMAGAVGGADLVLSAVTAANAVAVASDAAASVQRGAWFVDLNSAAPEHKRQASGIITQAGGRYVEVAVMSPILPLRGAAPMLLGGPHAREFASVAEDIGLNATRWYSDTVGPASATKLCRSIVVKGLEALVLESMLVAREWRVESEVLRSLTNLVPVANWDELAAYLITRTLRHGSRRAEEMEEAAAMGAEAGVGPVMATATAHTQAWAATYHSAADGADVGDVAAIVDGIRLQMPAQS